MPNQIPGSILRTWVSTPPDAWERLSERRYRAPHNIEGFVNCVVVVFGETVGTAAKVGEEDSVFAELFVSAARLGAHRVACEEAVPVVRPDNEANAGVVGRCWWCGKWPAEHVIAGGAEPFDLTLRRATPEGTDG